MRRYAQGYNSRLPELLIGVDVVEDMHDIPGEGFKPPDKVQRETGHIQNIVLKAPMGIDTQTGCCRRISYEIGKRQHPMLATR